jgi:hypothetical protein
VAVIHSATIRSSRFSLLAAYENSILAADLNLTSPLPIKRILLDVVRKSGIADLSHVFASNRPGFPRRHLAQAPDCAREVELARAGFCHPCRGNTRLAWFGNALSVWPR